jgi:hypothetical protein
VSFNSLNCDPDEDGLTNTALCPPGGETISDYAVRAVVNQPPQAAVSCDSSLCNSAGCVAYTGCVFTFNNDSTDSDGASDIISSEWDIFSWSGDPDLSCSPPTALCSYTLPTTILTPGIYTVELYVEDQAGASDTITQEFELKQEAVAGFMCSLDNNDWQVCETLNPSIGELVYFEDDSSLSEYSTPSQDATLIISRNWEIDGVTFDSDNNPNPSVNLTQNSNVIQLTITDDQGRTDSVSHTIGASLPLPEWKEVPPFSYLNEFLASVFGFLKFL